MRRTAQLPTPRSTAHARATCSRVPNRNMFRRGSLLGNSAGISDDNERHRLRRALPSPWSIRLWTPEWTDIPTTGFAFPNESMESGRRKPAIEHQVNDDAGDRDVEPDRHGPPPDARMFIPSSTKRRDQR